MSDLLQRIQQAQVEAAESAVVEDLQRKGLLTLVPPTRKQAILGSLDTVEGLMREYVAQLGVSERLEMQLRLSAFLTWARKRMKEESDNGETDHEA